MLILLVAAPASAQGLKWWRSEQVQQGLQLSADQVNRIEQIYDRSLPERRRLRRHLDKLEEQLKALLDDPRADDRHAAPLIDRVEAARARRNAARTMMLFHIRQVLTPEQRAALIERARRRR